VFAIGRCDVGADSCSTDTIRKLVDTLSDHRRPAVSDALVNEIVDEGKFFVAKASRHWSCHTLEYTNRRERAQDQSKCRRRLPSRSCSTATRAARIVTIACAARNVDRGWSGRCVLCLAMGTAASGGVRLVRQRVLSVVDTDPQLSHKPKVGRPQPSDSELAVLSRLALSGGNDERL